MEDFYQENTILETERLILRPLIEEDALPIYHNINHDKEVLKYYIARYIEKEEDASVTKTIECCKEDKRYVFAIVLKETNEVIGMINQCNSMNIYFHTIELGYAIGKKYWNKGYISECVKEVIKFFFDKGANKIYCSAIPENINSIKVMKKCGLVYEGRRIDDFYYHDRYWDVDYYYITKEMFHVKH